MEIKSSAFENNSFIPAKYTCEGEDVSPPLSISGLPLGTKSVALIVDDPDAPSGDFVHWLMWNIKPENNEIADGSVPDGAVEGMSDAGTIGYTGPCPPSGVHHYRFTAYALNTEIIVEPRAIKEDLEAAMGDHILDEDVLVGLYQRKN